MKDFLEGLVKSCQLFFQLGPFLLVRFKFLMAGKETPAIFFFTACKGPTGIDDVPFKGYDANAHIGPFSRI